MTAIIATFLFCWLVLTVAPRTAVGVLLHRWLVVAAARRLPAIRRADAVIGVTIIAAIVVMACCDDQSVLRMIVSAVPDAAL